MNEFDRDEINYKFSDYFTYIKTLGEGSFGKVVQAIDKITREHVAIKIIEKKAVKQEKILELTKEAEILSCLDHPNIVRFIDLKETDKRILLVMELIINGNLQQYLLKKKNISDLQASQIMLGVLRAVDYIHNKNVIHRDIKPENILVPNFSDLSQVKLADFGLSSQYDQSLKHYMDNENCGTLKYMAPEQTANKFYSRPVDLWSCGMLMYTLITSKHPLYAPIDTRTSYLQKLLSPTWSFPDNFSQTAKSLFLKLVELVPISRYTPTQALNHPWILRQEVKPPLTSFEKFKIYGEHLKLKGIAFPVFFAAIVAQKHFHLAESKTEENNLRIRPSLVSKKNLSTKTTERSSNTSSPEISMIKRARLISPGKKCIKKEDAKEIYRRKSTMRKRY